MFPGFNPNTVSVSKLISSPCVPSICTSVSVVNARTISVVVKKPDHNGGAVISSYATYATPVPACAGNIASGNVTVAASAASGTVLLTSLTPYTNYTITAVSNNQIGASVPSNSWSTTTLADVPAAPAIASVVAVSTTSVTISYTAPAKNNGSAIQYYVAQSCTGQSGLTYGAGNGTVGISCLTSGAIYKFKVLARNAIGCSAFSACSSPLAMPILPGSQTFSATGCWTVPAGVYNISVVAIGAGGRGAGVGATTGGGGGGGSLTYRNCISVTPGDVYRIQAGTIAPSMSKGATSIISASSGGTASGSTGGAGGTYSASQLYGGTGGGQNGGNGGNSPPVACGQYVYGGGGGAAGYSGAGGGGSGYSLGGANYFAGNGSSGSGGGGGGGSGRKGRGSGGGGGTGLFGPGTNGAGGASCGGGGSGGSGGSSGGSQTNTTSAGGYGGNYGGGSGGSFYTIRNAGISGVRIVWPGFGMSVRQFPSTCVGSP